MTDFVGPSYKLGDVQAACQRTVNMYVQRVGTPEKAQFILRAFPGFSATEFADVGGPAAPIGPTLETFILGFDDVHISGGGSDFVPGSQYNSLRQVTFSGGGLVTLVEEAYGEPLGIADATKSDGICLVVQGSGSAVSVTLTSARRIYAVNFNAFGDPITIKAGEATGSPFDIATISGTSSSVPPGAWGSGLLYSYNLHPTTGITETLGKDVRRIVFTVGSASGRIIDNISLTVAV